MSSLGSTRDQKTEMKRGGGYGHVCKHHHNYFKHISNYIHNHVCSHNYRHSTAMSQGTGGEERAFSLG